ncbi:uncharacterized protein KZ484_021865 isoform 1-T1 [Pholidichthys leucotaenia]
MGKCCCVVSCKSRSHNRRGQKINVGIGFYGFPAWKRNSTAHVSDVTKRRRLAWVAAIGRPNITFDHTPVSMVVCSKHFHKGKPAYEMIECDPDWAPSLNLGPAEGQAATPDGSRRPRRRPRTSGPEQSAADRQMDHAAPLYSGERVDGSLHPDYVPHLNIADEPWNSQREKATSASKCQRYKQSICPQRRKETVSRKMASKSQPRRKKAFDAAPLKLTEKHVYQEQDQNFCDEENLQSLQIKEEQEELHIEPLNIKEEQEEVHVVLVDIKEEEEELYPESGDAETWSERKELPHHYACKEEEILSDYQLCNQGRNSSLDQEEPHPPHVKEEEDEGCSSWNTENSVLTKEAVYEEHNYSAYKQNDGPLLSDGTTLTASSDEEGSKTENSSTWLSENSDEEQSHNENSEPTTDHKEIRPCCCIICGKRFLLRFDGALQDEMHFFCYACKEKIKESKKSRRNCLSCETCGVKFSQHWLLLKHKRIYSGGKPFDCDICGKRFRGRNELLLHTRTHTDEEPHTSDPQLNRVLRSTKSKVAVQLKRAPRLPPRKCFICGRGEKYATPKHNRKTVKETLQRCKSLKTGKLLQAAEARKDEDLLRRIWEFDSVASEVTYHSSCYRNYTRFLYTR